MVRHYRGVREYRRVVVPERNWATELWLYVGEPGTGKSYCARSEGGRQYWKQPSQWWDSYDGHEVVIFDEFRDHLRFVKLDYLQRLADRYPLLVETKGGNVPFLAKRLIITANSSPQDWFSKLINSGRSLSALIRRTTGVKVFLRGSNGEAVIKEFLSPEEVERFYYNQRYSEKEFLRFCPGEGREIKEDASFDFGENDVFF